MLVPVGELRGQSEEELAGSLRISAHNPLTGGELPTGTPYPVRGTLGDGVPDKIPFKLSIRPDRLNSELRAEEIEETFENTNVELKIINPAGELVVVGRRWGEPYDPLGQLPSWDVYQYEIERGMQRGWVFQGEIDLPFDVLAGVVLELQARLYHRDMFVDSLFTEIRPGMLELSIRSTITTGDFQGSGMQFTSTASGTTGLEFAPDYLSLSGLGQLEYEEFRIVAPRCSDTTDPEDGAFHAAEVVLFADSLPSPVAAPASGQDLKVIEVVFALDPSLRESPRPCGIPFPSINHLFAGFNSMHGGQVPGHPTNELDEARGGFVMGGWVPGTGRVIATRTYSRQGPLDGSGTLSEETTLELRWRE